MATIEGRNPVIEAIKNDREIDKIMIANSAKEGSIKKIIGMAKEKNIVIQYVLSILEIFTKNWSNEAVFNYLKTGFVNIDKEEIFKLENYCIRW